MKRFLIIISILLFTISVSAQNVDVGIKQGDTKIIVDIKPKIDKDNKEEYFLILKNPKTNKEWKITYSEWFTMTTSYHYWKRVSTQRPTISEVYEDDVYLYIVFNYYDDSNKDFLGIKINKTKESILSGKVLVPKKYLVARDAKKITIAYGIVAGLSVYGILVTIFCLIAIL